MGDRVAIEAQDRYLKRDRGERIGCREETEIVDCMTVLPASTVTTAASESMGYAWKECSPVIGFSILWGKVHIGDKDMGSRG
jgi:hypothetical protein